MNKVIATGLPVALFLWNYANLLVYGRNIMNYYGYSMLAPYLLLCCMGLGGAVTMICLRSNK